MTGCSLVSAIGSLSDSENRKPKSLQDIIDIYSSPILIIYLSVQSGIIIIILCTIKYLEYGLQNKTMETHTPGAPLSAVNSLFSFGLGGGNDSLSASSVEGLYPWEESEEASSLLPRTPLSRHPHSLRRKERSGLATLLSSSRYRRFKTWLKRKNRSVSPVGFIGAMYSIVGYFATILTRPSPFPVAWLPRIPLF